MNEMETERLSHHLHIQLHKKWLNNEMPVRSRMHFFQHLQALDRKKKLNKTTWYNTIYLQFKK